MEMLDRMAAPSAALAFHGPLSTVSFLITPPLVMVPTRQTTGHPAAAAAAQYTTTDNTMTLTVLGTLIEHNDVNEHGSAIFFVSNDHTGNIVIDNSVITNNSGGSWYPVYDGISQHSDTPITVTDSIIESNS